MPQHNIEPLEPAMWFEQIERLYRRIDDARESVSCAPLRCAFHLLQLAPRPLRSFLPPHRDETAIEGLLERGALLEAAMALFGAPLGLALRRDARSERFQATIMIPGASVPGSHADAYPAQALLGAWCRASMALKALPAGEHTPGIKSPPVQRERSSLH